MADKVIRVPVVAEFQTDLRSLQDIEKALSGAFEKAGTGTAIAKGLRDSLTKIRPLLKEYEQLQIQPTIDQAGVRRMNTIFDAIINEYQKRASQIEFADPEAMLPEEVLTRIRTMRAEVASLRKEMEGIEKHGASGKSDDYFQRREATAAQQDLHRRAKEVLPSKYSGDATLQQNASVVEKEATAAAQRAAALAEQGRKLAEALKQAEDGVQEAQTALRQATGDLQTATTREGKAQKAVNASKFYAALGGLTVSKTKEHAIVGGAGLRQSAFVDQSGKLQTEFQTMLRSVLQEAGIEIDVSRLIAESNASEIPGKIRQAIVDVLGDSEEAITQTLEDFKAKAQARLTRVDTEGFVKADQFLKSAREQRRAAQTTYDRAQQKAKEAPEQAFAIGYQIEENDEAQKEAQETAAALQSLSVALKEVAAAAKEAAVAAKKDEAESKEREVREVTEKEKNKVGQLLENTNRNLGTTRENHQEGNRRQGESFSQESNAQREAEDFKKSMQNAVKQWMSIQQVINIVKDGIRQAYQDIQGLDKAMTNIAVVTDMSVSDLWGKINEYMSIAQQYGVTTQGVYEVSQLYYQQGLSTNEVMAATTETLKLARIAGMGYAEAADAMTVAIRSFKMDMSDAATVTDVYSKVAAITASDSEELAIAMSKTASSAESVGSSFENTTAMLAVMIETTRESAQNLGSALKSIISRYGEMKVGLTVDSEGEEIDYNKVDTALKSVGISIKDAQGQFRDFDDVIFELSEKWDSLDKNTQRYIATIMAGNRQQSRFIALVDNWERLDEVSGAAHNAEDAGLLQYAKTLDSLETKLNNIKTSFQQFYMNIFNGPVIGAVLDFINNLIQGLNKLGNWQGILNIVGLIRNIKLIGTLIVNTIAPSMTSIVTQFKTAMQEIVQVAKQKGFEAGQEMARGEKNGYNSVPQNVNDPNTGNTNGNTGNVVSSGGMAKWGNHQKLGKAISAGGAIAGLVLTSAGTAIAADNARAGSIVSGLGNIASGASTGAMFGPWGAAIGGLIGGLASLPAVLEAFDPAKILEEKLQKAEEALQEANIEKAETSEKYTSMVDYIEKLKRLEETRYDSEENYEEWVKTNAEALEKFPELTSTFDETNNAIVDLIEAEESLTYARIQAAEAAKDAADAQLASAIASAASNKATRERNINKAWKMEFGGSAQTDVIQVELLSTGSWGIEEFYEWGLDPNKLPKGVATTQLYGGTGYYEGIYDGIWIQTPDGHQAKWEELFKYLLHNKEAFNWYTEMASITDPREFFEKFLKDYKKYFDFTKISEEDLFKKVTNNQYSSYADLAAFYPSMDRQALEDEHLIEVTANAAITQYLDASFLGAEENDYLELTGVKKAFQKRMKAEFDNFMESYTGDPDKAWETWTTRIGEGYYITEFTQLEDAWKNFYDVLDIAGLTEEFNSFASNAESYTWEEYSEILTQKFGLTAGGPVYASIQEAFNTNLDNFIQGLEGLSFFSFDEQEGNFSIEGIKELIPVGYTDEIMAYGRLLENSIEAGKITSEQALNFFNEYLNLWNVIGSSDLEPDQLAMARNMLAEADLTTVEGIAAFEEQFEKEFGIDIDLSTFSNFAHLFNNLNTQIQTAISTVTTISEGIKKLSESQIKGFSLEEANKIFAQLKKIDPSVSWDNIFTYNEQGLLVLKDFYDTAGKIYQDQQDNINELTNNLEDAEEILTEDNFRTFLDNNQNDISALKTGTSEQKAQARTNLIENLYNLGINKDVGAAFVDAIADGTIDSYNAMLEWFDAMGEELGAAAEWLRRETQKTFVGNAFDTRFNKFKTRKSAVEYASITSYEGLRQMIIDLAGNRVNEEGFDPDKWVASFFEDTDIDAYDANLLEGIELDELGNLIINDPIAYANSLIEARGIADKATIAAIHEAVFGAYHSQWEARTQQVETLLADYKFSTKEMSNMFGYLVGVNEIDLSEEKYLGKTPAEQMAVWANENGFTFKDGEWHALTREAYDTAVRTIAAQNPDADFSNIPTWKEWLGQQATAAATQHEKALDFLKEISIDMGPEKLNEAIELGLINANDISENDWSALAAGEMTVWDVMNKYYHPLEGTDYAEAWAIGQERYRQDAAKELNELFGKAAFKPEELLEIWEYIGNGQDFETWARQAGFEYDAVTQQYYARGEKAFATLTSYGKTRYGQDIDIPSSAAFYGIEQRAMAKELEDKKIAFFKELSPEAGIEELDKAYEQGIITQAQYLELLARAAKRQPIYEKVFDEVTQKEVDTDKIIGYTEKNVYGLLTEIADDDPELYQALLEGQASYEKQALTAIEEMFRDGTISADMISQMWSNVANQTTDMVTWAGQHGITYENGEWLIKTAEDAAKAYELMASWWTHEYKGTEMASQMPSKAEFVSMMSSAQKVEEEAINKFIKTITPDVTDADLQKAVEVGLLTWEEIASYQKEGKSTYEILIAAALKQGEEGQAALREAQKTYQQDATEAIESLFTDGFLSSEEIEKIWMNADTGEDMNTWATKAGFQLIDGEWQITSEKAYNEMLQWVKDTYGEAYALMVPSYETLVALNPLKEAKSKKASLDFLKELTPDMDESDVLSGVEQGVFTEDQVRWAQSLIDGGVAASWYEAMYATVGKQLFIAQKHLAALDILDRTDSEVTDDMLLGLLDQGLVSYEQYADTIRLVKEQGISIKEALRQVLSDDIESYNAQIAAIENGYLNYQAEGIATVRSMVEKGSWSEANIVKMWQTKGGAIEDFNNWANANFEWIDNAWYVKTEQGYNDLKAWIAKEYGTAAVAMLPSFAELQHLSLFKEKATSKEQLDFLKGLTSEASYADLEKAMELGLFTSEDLNKYLSENGLNINNLNSSNILTIIGNFIKSSDTEALKAFNKAIVDENISRGESALKLFEDNVLSWKEIAELWAADGATGDISTWAQGKGLSYKDNEWHITTREGYEAIVEAAKKIYGDAWEAVTPTYEAIMASQQLELDIDKDKQADFFEELASDKEVTAEDVQRALELGIVTEEQVYAAQQNGWSYERLLQIAMANNAEWKAAYQKGYGKYNEARLKELEEMFGDNDGVFSYEQVYRMWEVLGDGTDFNTWVGEQGLTFDGTSYKANAAKAYALMHGMATEWWGDAAASMIPSETAMASLFNIEREIQLDEQLDFMKGLTPEMTMADAQKAVELGIISQDQLLWLEQTYGDDMTHYFSFISQQFAAIEGADWDAFQESYEDYQATRMTEAQTFLSKTSFSLADMTNIWQATRDEGEEFGDWIEDLVFEGDLVFDGENWNVENPERIWPVIKEYIQEVYGFTDEDFDFEYMEQQFLASVHQQTANAKKKKLSFLRGLGETLTLDDLNEALDAGILTESEYDAVVSDGQITSDEIRGAIASSLETDEEVAAYNEAIEQRNLQRIETITALFEDTAISRDEIFEMYKASGATEDIILWAQQQGFVLEDGKWYAKTKQAYKAMEEYVIKQFGEAYTYLLPSEEEWLASGLFDDLIKRDSQISFIKEISPTASASTLKEAAEKFGIEFTQEELLLLEAGVIDYYDILLEKLKASDNKEWQNWASLIELQNVDAARRNVFKQTKFTTLEEYAAAYQQLADLGFTTHEIEYILADQTIDMEETANMIRALEARATGETNVYLQGEALLAAAKKYGLSLADFFERSVLSPAQVLEYLGLTLSDLSVDDYDDYITAQQNFNSSIQKLFEGTGTAEDMRRLIETANQAAISGYELTTDNFIVTAEGIQLDRSQFFTALEILRQTDANAYRAIRESFVADPSLWGEEIDSITDVEERLNELAEERAEVLEEINALGDERNEQLEQELAALDEQASLYAEIYGTMSMQKSDGWDFLNNELHGNAENFINWSNSVHSAFEQVGSKEGIDPKNFINLLNYMQQMGVQVTTLGSNFNSWAELMQSAYGTFGKAMVTGSKVATTDIGISAENMSTGMLDAVHAMAESQIKFLDAQIAMLEGLVALENVEFTGIGDFVTQMQAQLDKYNTAMGLEGDAKIKLDDLKISINGITYPLTEEGLAQAEAAWRALGYKGNFLDQLINQVFSPEGQKSIMSGGVVEMNPTADIKLSTDTQATISEIQTANSILREIAANTDPRLQQRIAKHKAEGGADLSTEAGAIKYFNDNSGVFRNILEGGVSASDKDAYEALSAFDKEIFNMWYASQHGTRFDQSDIYGYWYPGSVPDKPIKGGDGRATSTGGAEPMSSTYTYYGATKDSYKYVPLGNGSWGYQYAHNTDNGEEWLTLPENAGQAWSLFKDEFRGEDWGGINISDGLFSLENFDQKAWDNWFNRLGSEAQTQVKNWINSDPYLQGLFFMMTGQEERLPSYGAGVTTGGDGSTRTKPSFSMDASVSDIQGKVSGIYDNTAETNALLRGFDLRTEEGQRGYYNKYLTPEGIKNIPVTLPENWDESLLGAKPQGYDEMNNQDKLMAYQNAWLSKTFGWSLTDIDLWHKYSRLSATQDLDQDGNVSSINWAQIDVNNSTAQAAIKAIESYLQTIPPKEGTTERQHYNAMRDLVAEYTSGTGEDAEVNWEGVFADPRFTAVWTNAMTPYLAQTTQNGTTGTEGTAEQQTVARLGEANTYLASVSANTSGILGLLMSQQAEAMDFDLKTAAGAQGYLGHLINTSAVQLPAPQGANESEQAYGKRWLDWYNGLDPAIRAIVDVASGRVSERELEERASTASSVEEGVALAQLVEKQSDVQDKMAALNAATVDKADKQTTLNNLLNRRSNENALLQEAYGSTDAPTDADVTENWADDNKGPSEITGASVTGTDDSGYTVQLPWATSATAEENATIQLTPDDIEYFKEAGFTTLIGDNGFFNYIPGVLLNQWVQEGAEVSDDEKTRRWLVQSALYGDRYVNGQLQGNFQKYLDLVANLNTQIGTAREAAGQAETTETTATSELIASIVALASAYKDMGYEQGEALTEIQTLLGDSVILPEDVTLRDLVGQGYTPPTPTSNTEEPPAEAATPTAEEEPPAEQPVAEEEPPAEQPVAEEEPPAEVTIPTVEELQSQIAENTTIIEGLNSQIATLEGQITALEGQIATLEGQVTNLESQVTTLTTNNTDLAGQISTLNTTHAQDIAALEGQITLLNTQIATLQNRLSAKEDENRDLREAMNLLQTPGSPILAAGGYDYVWRGRTPFDKEGSYFYSEDDRSYSLRPLDGHGGRSMPDIADWEEMYGALAFGDITMPEITRAVDNGYISYSTTIGEEVIPIWAEGVGYTEEFSNSAFAAALPEEFWRLDFGSEEHREGTFSSMAAAWGAWESYADIFGGTHMLSLGMDENGNFTIELDFSEEAYENFGGAGQAEKDRQKWLQYTNPESFGYYNANTTLRDAILDGDPAQVGFFTGLQNLLPVIDSIQPPKGMEEEWHGLVSNLYAQIEDQDWGAVQTTLGQMSTIISSSSGSVSVALASLSTAAGNASIQLNSVRAPEGGATDGPASVSGNVSGLALAEGNTGLDRLNLGARLAGKTLVGELGPELAVYNGMYHLLGQNGAEFVNLPSDAIVFNHRQTAGIINGQTGYRGAALAEGNVDDIIKGDAFVNGHISGPALADASSTLAQLKNLRAMWQSILNMTAQDLANAGGGGGGGGNSLKAVTAELTEWYNLTRQIENLEQEINNLIAERENIAKDNGEAYLRNLRETQKLLQQQKLTQQILLDYQEKQLARQRDHINNHDIWSKFLTIGEDGLLQYIKGNETDDGKGALNVLQQLNKMSGKQQVDFIKKLGYSYTDKDGKKLKDSEFVTKFFEELQDQIDQYDELYDTVNGTKETIEELTSDIEKINDEILENQKELEEDVYKILVDAWEKEIKALEEQKELIEKANKAYVDGLKEALSAEKDLYEKNETTEKRESLQRQLSLLRRSGGSASEIADLEEQLDDTLKDEYFKNQERMIKNIEDANKEQIRKLEEQITLQKESLEYQKENGVLWTEVYNILAGTKAEILKFMQGNHTEFFSKSALRQEEMLTDWAHKIGIYTEERQYENHTKAATSIWDSNDLWNGEILKGMEDRYKGLKDNQKESLKKLFADTYANSMINGATEDESRKLAEEEVKKYLNQAYDENGNLIEEPEPVKPPSGSTNYVSVKYAVTPAEAKTAGCSISGPSMVTVGSEKGGLKLQTANGWDLAGFSSSDSSIASYSNGAIKAYKKGSVTITAKFAPSKNSAGTKAEYHSGAVESTVEINNDTGLLSEKISNFGGFKITDGKTVLQDSGEKYKTKDLATAAAKTALNSIDKKKYPNAKYTLYGFSQGGLVDYTGLAMVHGSKSKPESFLNASQTAQIKEALEATNGKENLLSGLHSTIDQLRSLIHNISTIDNSINSSITVAPGAVVINVDQLADSYDVEALSADIMNRMVSIASKATNRGVNRR